MTQPGKVLYTAKTTQRVDGMAVPPAETMAALTSGFRFLAPGERYQSGANVRGWLVGLFHRCDADRGPQDEDRSPG